MYRRKRSYAYGYVAQILRNRLLFAAEHCYCTVAFVLYTTWQRISVVVAAGGSLNFPREDDEFTCVRFVSEKTV
jgi:hypothetical protein